MEDWSARQYLKFEDERTRPPRDLAAQVPLQRPKLIVDLGCGPGNSTELLVERYPQSEIVGLDSSPDMLRKARERLPQCKFVEADIETWTPEPLFTYIAEAAEHAGRAVTLISIGRIGTGESLWRDLQSRYGRRFSFARLGERSQAEVSRFLQSIDFGIATSPWQLIGKSASTAAMLDHGLPVIVSRDDVDIGVRELEAHDPLLRRMSETLPQWLEQVRRRPPRDRLASLAARFITDIDSSTPETAVSVG